MVVLGCGCCRYGGSLHALPTCTCTAKENGLAAGPTARRGVTQYVAEWYDTVNLWVPPASLPSRAAQTVHSYSRLRHAPLAKSNPASEWHRLR